MAEIPRETRDDSTPRTHERLDSWKEIAAHLRRGVRTVQRWEKEEEMPVHRHWHDRQDSVYAYASELDAWWSGRRQRLEGEEPTKAQSSVPLSAVSARRSRWLGALLLASLVTGVGAYLWISSPSTPAAATGEIRSLAVLPFKPLVDAARDEYLELGMADALITRLSNVRPLVVRPTSAIVKYAGGGHDPVTAGRELKVDAILAGSLQRADERIRVTVQLVRVRDGRPLWADTFEQQWTYIFALQSSISERVTEALMLTLSGEEKSRLTRGGTRSTDAYQLYLKGRYCWNKRTEEWLKKAVEFFEQAIEKDPNYALAHVGLADAYNQLAIAETGGLPPREAFPRAKDAALKALSLDKTLAEAYAALGFAKLQYDWDGPGAERELKRAVELSPNYASAHQWYGIYLSVMGRHEEAIREARRAHELDPVSLAISRGVGFRLYEARRFDESIDHLQKTIELDPNFATVRYVLGLAFVQKAMFDPAIQELQQAVSLSRGSPTYIGALGYAHARAGKTDDARNLIEDLQQISSRRYVPPYALALVYIGLEDWDRAFAFLEKAYNERSSRLMWLGVIPEVDALRSDARFDNLVRRIGLLKTGVS